MNHTQVNSKFKDSLFRLVFRRKEELLSLYNAVNGSDYQNPEDLVINTMEDVVYMGMNFPFPPALECTAIMLNINYGHNKELMERCRKLEEYAFFVDQVRKLRTQGLSLETAADEAIRISLEHGVLTDILRKNRAEVKDLILTEYNEELHIKNEKNISYEEGMQDGLEKGLFTGISASISICREMGLDDAQILKKLLEKFSLSEAEARQYLKE